MKKLVKFVFALVLVACGLTLAACGGGNQGGGNTNKTTEFDITVWVSEVEGVKELTQTQIQRFATENGLTINATVEGMSEGDSATQMLTSVEDGADIFCFAQDQLARLVQAGALAKLGVKAGEAITAANTAGSVNAAKVNNELYCYPLTDDNGFFMFYDKSVIQASSVDSLEAIIADCEAAGKMFSYQLTSSAWYNASFFFATGCHSTWTTDEDGNFTSVDDNFNSEAGVIALKGMQKLLKSKCFTSSDKGTADFGAAIPSAVVISGTWDINTAKENLGDNYAVAKLPSFTVDGKTYQLGSFNGCKLMGVKPTKNAEKSAMLQKLATYLTDEACQMERFNQFGWGPSNKKAQSNEAVQKNEALCALAAQNVYAIPQGNIHGSWWNIALSYATAAQKAETDADLTKALADYQAAIDGLFNMDTTGYIMPGVWNGWSNADNNFRLKEVSTGIYEITVTVKEEDSYKGGRIVTPGNWDTNMGCTIVVEGNELIEEDGGSDNNIVFKAAGTYKITFDSVKMQIKVSVVD